MDGNLAASAADRTTPERLDKCAVAILGYRQRYSPRTDDLRFVAGSRKVRRDYPGDSESATLPLKIVEADAGPIGDKEDHDWVEGRYGQQVRLRDQWQFRRDPGSRWQARHHTILERRI
jgi:hypothetical protein